MQHKHFSIKNYRKYNAYTTTINLLTAFAVNLAKSM